MNGDYCDSCRDFIQWDDQNGCAVDPMYCGECYQRLRHRLRRVQAAARKLADERRNLAEAVGVFADGRIEDQARHHDLLRALKRWHNDVEEGTVCSWCDNVVFGRFDHTEDCPWRWILDACREAGVK